jgi:hypothetical protein
MLFEWQEITLTVRPAHRLLVDNHLLILQQHILRQARKQNLTNSTIQHGVQCFVNIMARGAGAQGALGFQPVTRGRGARRA